MGVVAIDHVQIAAPPGAEAAARNFYGELLGLPEISKPPALLKRGGVWFRVGQQALHVGIDENFVAARKAHPAFLLASPGALTELADRLAAAGVRVRWDEAIAGQRRCFVSDPWGNRIELIAPRSNSAAK